MEHDMVGWIIASPQEVPIQIPTTCEYVVLLGKRDFADDQLRILRGGDPRLSK